MIVKFKNFGKLLRTSAIAWYDKDPFRESAIIAYYAVFSIPGLLLVIITATGYFFGKEIVSEKLLEQISQTMGADIAHQIQDILVNASQSKSTVWASVLGIIVLLVGATGVFVELQKTFNRIWHVTVVPKKGILTFLKARLFSFGLIVAIAFLLLISLVISTALSAMGDWIEADTSAFVVKIFSVFHFAFSLLIISLLFAIMFKILPDAKIKWKHVWLGSLLTGLLFTVGKTALAYYFGKMHPASAYGAAGSVILMLLWVSYSSMIVFFGAEFTAAYAKMVSGHVNPSEIAVRDAPEKPKSKHH